MGKTPCCPLCLLCSYKILQFPQVSFKSSFVYGFILLLATNWIRISASDLVIHSNRSLYWHAICSCLLTRQTNTYTLQDFYIAVTERYSAAFSTLISYSDEEILVSVLKYIMAEYCLRKCLFTRHSFSNSAH